MSADFSEEISEPCPEGSGVTIDDFCAFMPMANAFFFLPCRELWPGSNIDKRLPRVPVLTKSGKPKRVNGKPVTIAPTKWIIQNRSVEQTTWAPGWPLFIPNRLCTSNGWIEREGVTSFNQYRAPQIKPGDASKAGPWLEHVRKICPDEAEHIIAWLAHRVQCPQEKINHTLVLGGLQGIGKDTLIEPVRRAVGPWNFHDVSPTHMMDSIFNGYAKAVILRISEGRDLGDTDRFKFYEHLKTYIVTPPYTMRVNEKHLREYYILNCIGLIITTNYKTDGIYLPADDRRHYVAWSSFTKEDFAPDYWNTLWGWYNDGGFEHVATYLGTLDLSHFDPKAPPPKTPAFWEIVDVNRAPEDAELADVIDALGNPDATTPNYLTAKATGRTADWLMEPKNRRALPHRLERCGYVAVRNPDAKDGYWVIGGTRQPIYAKNALLTRDRVVAARKLKETAK
jgi:hypothetical protein